MRPRHRALSAASLLTLIALAACSFPEISFRGAGGAGGASSASGSGGSASSAGGGAGGSTSSTSGTGGGTSSTTTSGTGGAAPCSKPDADPCDCDGDKSVSWKCNGPDCADEDGDAHPGGDYQKAAIQGEIKPGYPDFDFNCDGTEELQFKAVVVCGLAQCDVTDKWTKDVPDCGEEAPISHCAGFGTCSTEPGGKRTQGCR